MQTGNIVAANKPFLRFSSVISAIFPTKTGPAVAPRSPANAKNANIAVPPPGHLREEREIVPGHIIPTARPQSAHPANPSTAQEASEASK